MRHALLHATCAVSVSFSTLLGAASAATIHVPADIPSIQGAIALALPGDSVIVAPGFYVENIDFLGKSITVKSEYGAPFTHIRPANPSQPTVKIHGVTVSGAVIEGFDIRGGNADQHILVCTDQAHATIRNNQFIGNDGWNRCINVFFGEAAIIGNVIADNGARHAVDAFGPTTITDNTICANGLGVEFFNNFPGTVRNNIIVNNASHGLGGQPGNAEYNLMWMNGSDFECDWCYPNNLSAAPLFLGQSVGEFMLREGSPAIDAGDPDPAYNDADGTRNDIGALPRVPAGMTPWNVRVGLNDRHHVTEESPYITWQRYSTSGPSQEAYEIEIGTNLDWSVAELWATGPIALPYSFAQYTGPDWNDGTTYYLRIRLRSAGTWGEWREMDLHTNRRPTRPNAIFPSHGDTVPAHPITLRTQNAIDPDGDKLEYQFKIYADEALSIEVASSEIVHEASAETPSGVIAALTVSTEYWWRVRASDGFEWGEWSDSVLLNTSTPVVRHVPEQHPSIQAAIDAAVYLDTVAVAPGDYQENVSFRGAHVCVVATGGPAVTRIRPDHPSGSIVTFGLGEGRSALWSGFTMHGGYAAQYIVVTNESSPEISGNVLRDYKAYGPDPAVIGCWHGSPLIRNNLFINNGGVACVGNSYLGSARIENNTFVNNHRGFYTITGDGAAINNIVINSTEYGIYGLFAEQHHNLAWGNNPDYDGGATPHATNLSADPWFCDPDVENFSLSAISPCATSGTDGSYMGALPVTCAFPVSCHCDCHADPNCDSVLNIVDVILTIDRAFAAGSESNDSSCVVHGVLVDGRTDVDCSGYTDLADAVKMIDVALRGADRETKFCAPCTDTEQGPF